MRILRRTIIYNGGTILTVNDKYISSNNEEFNGFVTVRKIGEIFHTSYITMNNTNQSIVKIDDVILNFKKGELFCSSSNALQIYTNIIG